MSQIPKLDLPQLAEPAPAVRPSQRAESETAEPTTQARLLEIEAMMREILRGRRESRFSKLALVAVFLAAAALLCSGAQAYYAWAAYAQANESTRQLTAMLNTPGPVGQMDMAGVTPLTDLRTEVTIRELAKRAPSLRTGTLQAWWAGEQARQVQRLEAQAKRQTLAGDREGAAQSASRADTIRNSIPKLAEFERAPAR